MTHITQVPARVNTPHGTLDSEIMVSQTVGTIIRILTKTRSLSKDRRKLLKYYDKCVEKNQQMNKYVGNTTRRNNNV